MPLRLRSTLAAFGALIATAALAAAPQPIRPVPEQLYSGRWYEIARTPNSNQRDCHGATSDFAAFSGEAFHVVQTCHRGAASGAARVFRASGRIVPASNNAKMQLAFFGGMVRQEYWILDRADDGSWAIMATPGGNYVWLLSRRPVLDAASRARLLSRISQLGYNTGRLQFPQQAP